MRLTWTDRRVLQHLFKANKRGELFWCCYEDPMTNFQVKQVFNELPEGECYYAYKTSSGWSKKIKMNLEDIDLGENK